MLKSGLPTPINRNNTMKGIACETYISQHTNQVYLDAGQTTGGVIGKGFKKLLCIESSQYTYC